MRPLSIVLIAVLPALTAALPHRRSHLEIPIYKRLTLARDGVVNLDALRSHIAYSERKYSEGVAAFERHTSVLPRSSRGHTPTRRAVGANPLTAEGNELWYGTISVGSPAVEYKGELFVHVVAQHLIHHHPVAFDTGSADLFIPASNCGSTCDGHTPYNPNASSSAVDLGRNFSIAYGDGSTVAGDQYIDTVTIAGFVAKNQTIGAASQYSTGFQTANFAPDGLMGMAFAGISLFPANPVVQTLIAEGQLSDPVFAFKLASSGSELRIGGIDSSSYTGPFTYTPVTVQDSINANGQAISTNISAIVDTGTTFILGDTQIVGQFYNGPQRHERRKRILHEYVRTPSTVYFPYLVFSVPCNAMPNVSITIGGKLFAISAETFNLGSYNSSGNDCIGAIAATGSLGDTWILGDVFLRNVYSVFDIGQLRVGFADLA
ncbi:acid protease [Lanmaoa asiatica]|nr:acid protease [Lanmaoa asiatica]